jgi:hypothetical protein
MGGNEIHGNKNKGKGHKESKRNIKVKQCNTEIKRIGLHLDEEETRIKLMQMCKNVIRKQNTYGRKITDRNIKTKKITDNEKEPM